MIVPQQTMIYQRHRNPGASGDLIIPIHVTLNTPDDVIHANVHANSRLPGKEWIRISPAHDRVAVVCGSGPSLNDHMDKVRALRADPNVDVFALNGCAAHLDNNGLRPDYQVIADARERTAELVGPAREHLFASQVHPACFERAPDARIWHFDNGDMESQLPPYERSYALIGAAGSVGNCALGLAWAMGYRRFELFGYDSSHRDNRSHAFYQPMNDFEPYGRFPFNGKDYLCSYTMRSQVGMFMLIARELMQEGCTLTVHGDGILPDMWRESERMRTEATLEEREEYKYKLMWDVPGYRDMSPAERHFDHIRDMLANRRFGLVVDFGCGTARALKRIEDELHHEILGIDFVNATENGVPFVKANLWQLPDIDGDYGICCDVMEHIPPERIDDVLGGIRASVRGHVFFSICSEPECFGREIGESLHVSLYSPEWWAAKLQEFWPTVRQIPGGIFICETEDRTNGS